MRFGILKSKIERVLLESYVNDTFKEEIKNFKKYVLENKNISKLFYLYDELNSPKSLNESHAREYINESINMYENIINKIRQSDINKIKTWVGNKSVENQYDTIDVLFSSDILTIESKIKCRNILSESLRKLPVVKTEEINLPLSTMVSVANKTINSYIDCLTESDKRELISLLSEDDLILNQKYVSLKEGVVTKLTEMKNINTDTTMQTRIEDTISKVINEKYNKLSYFKLKSLKENL